MVHYFLDIQYIPPLTKILATRLHGTMQNWIEFYSLWIFESTIQCIWSDHANILKIRSLPDLFANAVNWWNCWESGAGFISVRIPFSPDPFQSGSRSVRILFSPDLQSCLFIIDPCQPGSLTIRIPCSPDPFQSGSLSVRIPFSPVPLS